MVLKGCIYKITNISAADYPRVLEMNEKIAEKSRRCAYKFIHISLAKYPSVANLVLN